MRYKYNVPIITEGTKELKQRLLLDGNISIDRKIKIIACSDRRLPKLMRVMCKKLNIKPV